MTAVREFSFVRSVPSFVIISSTKYIDEPVNKDVAHARAQRDG